MLFPATHRQLPKKQTLGDGTLAFEKVDRNECAELSEVKATVVRRVHDVASMMLRIDEQATSKEMVKSTSNNAGQPFSA
jgi:hypothetical protein